MKVQKILVIIHQADMTLTSILGSFLVEGMGLYVIENKAQFKIAHGNLTERRGFPRLSDINITLKLLLISATNFSDFSEKPHNR